MKKYPKEITGSGYSLRDGEVNSWHNSYQVVAKKLKDGTVTYRSLYNYSKGAGTPWVRCLNEQDAKKVIDYLESNHIFSKGSLTPVKNGNEQVLALIDEINGVPVYICTGEYHSTKYILDKKDGKIKSAEDAGITFPNLSVSTKVKESEKSLKTWLMKQICTWYKQTMEKDSGIESFNDQNFHEYTSKSQKELLSIKDRKYLLNHAHSFITSRINDITVVLDIEYKLDNSSANFIISNFLNDYQARSNLEDKLWKIKDVNIANVSDYGGINVSTKFNYTIPAEVIFDGITLDHELKDSDLTDIQLKMVKNVIEYIKRENLLNTFENDIKEKSNEIIPQVDKLLSAYTNDSYLESLDEAESRYKWIFDTIRVYVINMRDGRGWDQELEVKNNSINDTIKDYKKSLGKGYWIDYIGPGKMHKANLNEDENTDPDYKLIEDNQYYRAYQVFNGDGIKKLGMVANNHIGNIPENFSYYIIIGKTGSKRQLETIIDGSNGECLSDFYDDKRTARVNMLEILNFLPAYEFMKAKGIKMLSRIHSESVDCMEILSDLFEKYGTGQVWVLANLCDKFQRSYDPFGYDEDEIDTIIMLIHDDIEYFYEESLRIRDELIKEKADDASIDIINSIIEETDKYFLGDQIIENMLN